MLKSGDCELAANSPAAVTETADFAKRWIRTGTLLGLLFCLLALAVTLDLTQSWDWTVLKALRAPGEPQAAWGPSSLQTVMRDLTSLGSFTILLTVFVSFVGFRLTQRNIVGALQIGPPFLIAWVLSESLKFVFDRPRPPIAADIAHLSASFPSGHALLSMCVYLTIGLAFRQDVSLPTARRFCLILPLIVTGAVGWSRLYLGMHYPTDVLGGWLVGASIALAWQAIWFEVYSGRSKFA